jgi:hypothetical protein
MTNRDDGRAGHKKEISIGLIRSLVAALGLIAVWSAKTLYVSSNFLEPDPWDTAFRNVYDSSMASLDVLTKIRQLQVQSLERLADSGLYLVPPLGGKRGYEDKQQVEVLLNAAGKDSAAARALAINARGRIQSELAHALEIHIGLERNMWRNALRLLDKESSENENAFWLSRSEFDVGMHGVKTLMELETSDSTRSTRALETLKSINRKQTILKVVPAILLYLSILGFFSLGSYAFSDGKGPLPHWLTAFRRQRPKTTTMRDIFAKVWKHKR